MTNGQIPPVTDGSDTGSALDPLIDAEIATGGDPSTEDPEDLDTEG